MMLWEVMAQVPAANLAAFLAGALALNVAPGPDVLFATACGMQGGPRAGALAGIGVGIGSLGHVAMAVLGLGALIAARPGLLAAIQWVGAGYLLWLAWKSWRARPHAPGAGAASRPLAILGRGMLSNLLNPKPVLFFLAFLPQFVAPAFGPVWQQLLGLGLIFVCTGTAITAAYGMAAGWLGARLGARMGLMNRIAALMFVGLAARLILR